LKSINGLDSLFLRTEFLHMEIIGKLIQLLPPQTGEGKNGPWKKQDIIVEQQGQVPKKVCVSIWGDKLNIEQYAIGSMLTLQADVESREYNTKWYTDVKAWKIEGASSGQEPKSSEPSYVDSEPAIASQDTDDLPF
jgi:hypothetical protein